MVLLSRHPVSSSCCTLPPARPAGLLGSPSLGHAARDSTVPRRSSSLCCSPGGLYFRASNGNLCAPRRRPLWALSFSGHQGAQGEELGRIKGHGGRGYDTGCVCIRTFIVMCVCVCSLAVGIESWRVRGYLLFAITAEQPAFTLGH